MAHLGKAGPIAEMMHGHWSFFVLVSGKYWASSLEYRRRPANDLNQAAEADSGHVAATLSFAVIVARHHLLKGRGTSHLIRCRRAAIGYSERLLHR